MRMYSKGFTSNFLKLLAAVAMTMDHIGILLLPHAQWLRAAGRLSFPIFAFMIAEGCRHTRSLKKYLLTMAVTAVFCQAVSYLATGSLYQCILVTFSLSIGLFWLVRLALAQKPLLRAALLCGGVLAVFFLTELLPLCLPHTDYAVDYGFIGALLPVGFALCATMPQKLLCGAVLLSALALRSPAVQWLGLLSLPLLALYNGRRGKQNLKWFFYIYYPAHLGILYLLAALPL